MLSVRGLFWQVTAQTGAVAEAAIGSPEKQPSDGKQHKFFRMTALTSADKDKIKRVVPKSSNKIIDAAIIRLYVNYPNLEEWTWTGLMGAVVLVDDLIGHTFFFKLVDVIGNQGVLWDQELWVDFQYSQDRLFFHSFEIEDFSVGFLFEDKSEAQHFFKRVQNRHKHASKLTIQNNNAVEARKRPEETSTRGYRGEEFDKDGSSNGIVNEQRMRRTRGILYYDNEPPPEWRSFYKELENMGISEDMIAENREFIKDYIAKQGGPLVGLEPPIPRRYQNQVRDAALANGNGKTSRSISQSLRSRSSTVTSISSDRKKKAPPPPPPPASSSSGSAPSVPSPPPYSNSLPQSVQEDSYPDMEEVIEQHPSSSSSSAATPAPQQSSEPHRVHNVPPPMTFPSPFQPSPAATPSPAPGLPPRMAPSPASTARPVPSLPSRANMPPAPPARGAVAMVPPPPPSRGNVPPPPPSRSTNAPVPPPPRRGQAPPPPPSRHTGGSAAAPPLPPGHPGYNPYGQEQQQPPQLPPQQYQQYQQSPPQLPPQIQQQQQQQPPPPPQMPAFTNPSPPSANSAAPPPPPPPPMPTFTNPPAAPGNSSAPPPPPPPPALSSMTDTAPPRVESTGDSGRDALLASIRGAGIHSLKKVDKSQLDKPSVLLQEARGEPVSTPAAPAAPGGAPGQPASLADALAAALSSRKAKVAVSDDESDGDW